MVTVVLPPLSAAVSSVSSVGSRFLIFNNVFHNLLCHGCGGLHAILISLRLMDNAEYQILRIFRREISHVGQCPVFLVTLALLRRPCFTADGISGNRNFLTRTMVNRCLQRSTDISDVSE